MKDSLYTVSYAAVMGTVAAFLLAGVWKFTTPYREANERMEEVRNVMKVLEVPHDPNMPADELIALFELTLQGDEIKVVEERHYRLVPAKELNRDAIRDYRN